MSEPTLIPSAAENGNQPSADHYVGLATRVIAFVVDAALITFVAIVVGVGGALILSLLHLPDRLHTLVLALSGAAYILWTIGYFVTFWSTTGQTPGNRLMQIRVKSTNGEVIKPRRALVRAVGVFLAALPLFAGYALILFDRRCRGLHDRLAGTVVVDAPDLSLAQIQRARHQATYARARVGSPSAPQ
jgi:uncharacterized RDD family membrane protein YckC